MAQIRDWYKRRCLGWLIELRWLPPSGLLQDRVRPCAWANKHVTNFSAASPIEWHILVSSFDWKQNSVRQLWIFLFPKSCKLQMCCKLESNCEWRAVPGIQSRGIPTVFHVQSCHWNTRSELATCMTNAPLCYWWNEAGQGSHLNLGFLLSLILVLGCSIPDGAFFWLIPAQMVPTCWEARWGNCWELSSTEPSAVIKVKCSSCGSTERNTAHGCAAHEEQKFLQLTSTCAGSYLPNYPHIIIVSLSCWQAALCSEISPNSTAEQDENVILGA